jgi:hypothetical protein
VIALLGFRVEAIKEILRTLGLICFQLLVLAGRNILFQAAEEKAEFHVGRNVTNPHVHAGFQFVKMFFDLEARTFHEIGRKKPGNALNNPGMFFYIAIADSKFDDLCHWNGFK